MSEHSLLLRPTGRLDADSCSELRQQLATAFSVGVQAIVVDLAAVTVVDRVGLGVLSGAARHLHRRGGALVVTNAAPDVVSLMHVNGLAELLEVTPSRPLRVLPGAGQSSRRPRNPSLSVVRSKAGA